MAKYDVYTLRIQVGKDGQEAIAEISVLLEDGDVVATVLANARNVLRAEAAAMKTSGFIEAIKQ